MTTEEIVSKYSGSENIKETIKLQHMIEDYVLYFSWLQVECV
jgi:hypothetical protein